MDILVHPVAGKSEDGALSSSSSSSSMGGAGGVAVSPSHRDREGHGFKSHWSPQQ